MARSAFFKIGRIVLSVMVGLGIALGLLILLNAQPTTASASLPGSLDSVTQGQLVTRTNQLAVNAVTVDEAREGWDNALPYPPDPISDHVVPGRIDWKYKVPFLVTEG